MKKLISLKIIKQRKKSNELIEKIKQGNRKVFEILVVLIYIRIMIYFKSIKGILLHRE